MLYPWTSKIIQIPGDYGTLKSLLTKIFGISSTCSPGIWMSRVYVLLFLLVDFFFPKNWFLGSAIIVHLEVFR